MEHWRVRFGAELPPGGQASGEKLSALSAMKVALGSIGFLWVALILSLLR